MTEVGKAVQLWKVLGKVMCEQKCAVQQQRCCPAPTRLEDKPTNKPFKARDGMPQRQQNGMAVGDPASTGWCAQAMPQHSG